MSRATQKDGLLRGCPTCGTRVSEADLGLRDYRWVNEALPGKVGGMDLDFCISQARTGRALFLEFKPAGGLVSTGARLTFKLLREKGFEVWVVWDRGDIVDVSPVLLNGELGKKRILDRAALAEDIRAWWDAGLEEAS